jgi:hypothetical protein
MSKLTIEEWDKKFQPATNPFNKEASWNGVMFETYGEELDYVQCHDENHVWTLVDGDLGISLLAGYYVVNRIGYFVTEVAWEDTIEILVHEDSQPENNMEKTNNIPALQAHFVVYFDTTMNEWQIEPDQTGCYFPNGDVWLKDRDEWVLSDETENIETLYANLATELLNKLNNKVGK